MTDEVQKVVLVGNDHALWLAAAVLRAAFGPTGLAVTAVALPSPTWPHDARGSLPPLEGLHGRIGLDEADLLKACAGTYSLGMQCADFTGGVPFFVPFGGHGPGLDEVPFAALYARARAGGLAIPYEEFAINAAAAKQGRFFVANAETSSYALCDHGYHLDLARYAAALERRARSLGVRVISAGSAAVRRDPEQGHVTAIVGDGRAVIGGDFFVDCTSGGALVDDGAAGAFESWADWLPFDRVLTGWGPPLRRLPAYGQMRATPNGIVSLYPLQDKVVVRYSYVSAGLADDAAAWREAAAASGIALRDSAQVATLRPGRRTSAWTGNLTKLGDAFCTTASLYNVELHMLQLGLALLITHFPRRRQTPASAAEYSRRVAGGCDRLRDFQIATLKLGRRPADPLWTSLAQMDVPTALADKLDALAANGELAKQFDETFQEDSWHALFFGTGNLPGAVPPLAFRMPDQMLIRLFKDRLGFVAGLVREMNSHDAHVELHCRSAAA